MILANIQFDERDLIERVMHNMRPCKRRQLRWILVRDTFGVGSTVAYAMCREFNLDPEENLTP
ncbi:hypothetical protein HZF02_32695 (plasmid) [Pseudomonas yamanorum]|nr:hypothetical protein HZF02_32695 [Pseudomonas yamanorum]